MGRGGGGGVVWRHSCVSRASAIWHCFGCSGSGGGGGSMAQHVELDLLGLVHLQIPQRSSFMIRSILP